MTSIRPSREIAQRIADKHAISCEVMLNHSKKFKVVRARQEYWAELVLGLNYSLPRAGQASESKFDYTTVLYGVRRHAATHLDTPPDAGLVELKAAYASNRALS